MALRVYASSGGGVRIGGTFGALRAGERLRKFSPYAFDFYIGTSAGALDAALTASGWLASEKIALFLDTDFQRFFQPTLGPLPLLPFAARKALALQWPISLAKLEAFYETLTKPNRYGPPVRFAPGLLINTVDADENRQVVYCSQLPEWANAERDSETGRYYTFHSDAQSRKRKMIRWEVGTVSLATAMARSSVLPGLVADDPRYMDGGIAENPLLSPLPRDVHVLLMHLGYPGLVGEFGKTLPTSILDRALYAYEFKAAQHAEHLIREFPNLSVIYPGIYTEESANFAISRQRKQTMIDFADIYAVNQWLQM